MASIKLILRKNQEDKTGHCPLYINVTQIYAKVINTELDTAMERFVY
ncbi:MAG: hypothetical protein LBE36_02285 [Flavobacteriaceae bacterium]|jgi:hypothetical protein|nr:hypothetical protein [Flavobacteriaceae bacterium]